MIDRYGYILERRAHGGGINGIASQLDENDFFRDAGQIAYNVTLGSTVTHDLHVGYQQVHRLGGFDRAARTAGA